MYWKGPNGKSARPRSSLSFVSEQPHSASKPSLLVLIDVLDVNLILSSGTND